MPAVVLVVPLKFWPLLQGFRDSVFEWPVGGRDPVFVGLEHYSRIVADPTVRRAFLNVLLVLLTLPVWVVAPFVVAFLLYLQPPGWKIFRAVYLLPVVISPVIVGLMFREILHPSGPLNALLHAAGLGSLAFPWLADTRVALWALVAVVFWAFFGLGVIIYLAGLASLPSDTIEAAKVDGAGFWAVTLRVALPQMLSVVGFWALLVVGVMFIWMFPFIHALTRGGPGDASMLPEYLIYLTTFRFFERGYGTALGMALFGFVFLVAFALTRTMYAEVFSRDRR